MGVMSMLRLGDFVVCEVLIIEVKIRGVEFGFGLAFRCEWVGGGLGERVVYDAERNWSSSDMDG